MANLQFYAVCHSSNDGLNKGIESLGSFDERLDTNDNILKKKVNLLTSFSEIFKNNLNDIHIPSNVQKLIIDSGAYDFIIRNNGSYPYSTSEYYNKLKRLRRNGERDKIDYVVSMDYICSPDEHDKNIKKINKTISNVKELMGIYDKDTNKTFQILPVVQGYDVKEYVYCVKKLIKAKIIKSGSYFGVGSLANRKKVIETRNVINAIWKELNKNKIKSPKIHLFGISINTIKDKQIAEKIYSFDSLSWIFPYRFGRIKAFTGKRMIEVNTRKKLKEPEFYHCSLRATLRYIDYISEKFKNKNFPAIFEQYCQTLDKNYKKMVSSAKEFQELDNICDEYQSTNRFKEDNLENIILVFTGKKLEILEPKSTKLTRDELYFTTRSTLLIFLSHISTLDKNRIDEFRDDKEKYDYFTKYLVEKNSELKPIIEFMENFTKKENKNEQIRTINFVLNQILPIIGDHLYLSSKNRNSLDVYVENNQLSSDFKKFMKKIHYNFNLMDSLMIFSHFLVQAV